MHPAHPDMLALARMSSLPHKGEGKIRDRPLPPPRGVARRSAQREAGRVGGKVCCQATLPHTTFLQPKPCCHRAQNGGGDIVFAAAGIDHPAAVARAFGNLEMNPAHAFMKTQIELLEAHFMAVPRTGTLQSDLHRQIENQASVRA